LGEEKDNLYVFFRIETYGCDLISFFHFSMKNKFLLGAVVGVSALVASVPFLVQLSSAASASSTAAMTHTSSVTNANDTDKEVPDAEEAALNASQAKITAEIAAQTAMQAQPGTVHENKLDNERGSLVYKVEITNAGKEYDVLVDATNGKVIKNWEDGNDVNDVKGQDDANEVNDQANPNEKEDGNDAATFSATSTASAQ
jgi:uncharacterized membrane protein YkoI